MHFEFEMSLLCEEGFDHYQTVVIEASSAEEATQLAQEAMTANLGEYWVSGVVYPGVQIEICTPGPKAPRTLSAPAPKCGDHKFLTPTGRRLYGVEEALPLTCEGKWEWNVPWVECPLAQTGNCP
jgi:hypothetical protein